MFITKIFIERPRMLLMIVLALAIFGGISYFGLPLTLMPDVELPYVTVQTVYPGAGPKEIETLITKPVEDAVSTLSGIKQMTSYSLENVSFVIIEFESDVDANFAKMDVKDKVDGILSSLPNDAEKPIVQSFDIGADAIVEISLIGTQSTMELYEFADKNMRDRLSQVKGVAQLSITGGTKREIQVRFDRKTLENYGLSLVQVVGYLGMQNINMPGGYIKKLGNEYTVRLDGEFHSVDDINNIEIPTASGMKRLSDIGVVLDTQEDQRELARFYSKDLGNKVKYNAVKIGIQKSTDANEVETAALAIEEIEKIKEVLPDGMKLIISQDNSLFTKGSQSDTMSNIIIGIILTAFILLLFLHDIRSTIIVSLSMPVAIVTTFILISISGFSLNMMTLMGISISVGILVTNSIVVIENIYRHATLGEDIKSSSLTGATEIAIAVAATTLTNVVVFLPIANMSGIIGGIFKEFGLTVTYATIVSLVTAFTLTPMLSAYLLRIEKIRKLANPDLLNGFSGRIEKTMKSIENGYKKLLTKIVGHKGSEIAFIVVTLLILFASFLLFPMIGGEFMPYVDDGLVQVKMELPTNYNLDRTNKVSSIIENRIQKHPEVETITTTLGNWGFVETGQNLASFSVKLVSVEERDFGSNEFVSILMKELADIPDAKLQIQTVNRVGGGPGAAIEMYVMGQNQDKVTELASDIMEIAEEIPGAVNVSSDFKPGKPEIKIVPDRVKCSQMGVTASTLAMELRGALEGIVATKYRESGYEYDIKIRMSDKDKASPEMVGQIPVATPMGTVPLEQLAKVEYSSAAASITRVDRYNTVTVSMGNDENHSMQEVLNNLNKEIDEKITFPSGYKTSLGGQSKMMEETFTSMFQALLLAIILTYMLLVSILESFLQPFIIFFTIPLSLIGVLLSLFLTGNALNVISFMSIIMLMGIVVNNAILLIDYTNVLRKKGMSLADAIINACPVKLKPIVMSTLAIALGMLPLAMGIGSEGVEMRQAMGIVTIGGLTTSAFFTMFIIPILFRWFAKGDVE